MQSSQQDRADERARRSCRVLLLGASGQDADWLAGVLESSLTFRFELVRPAPIATNGAPVALPAADVALVIHTSAGHAVSVDALRAGLPATRLPMLVIGDSADERLALGMIEAGAALFISRGEVTTQRLATGLVAAVEGERRARRGAIGLRRGRRFPDEDPLTSLATRDLFHDRLSQALAAARRSGLKTALLIVDIDNFKLVNETLGSAAGDALLKIVAGILSSCLRETDTAARHGGDEFAILLTNLMNELDSARIAMKILDALRRPIPVEGHSVFTSVSVGISTAPRCGDDPEELLRQADTAMRHAKKRGRNRMEFFNEEMTSQVTRRLTIESGLRTAAEDGSLHLHYQPMFDLRRSRLVGAEALIRWQHGELGALAPDDFLPLAEESGLILPIGEWVLQAACQQAVEWQRMGHEGFRMAVNVSPLQLQEPSFRSRVERALQSSGLSAKSLELEITESTLVKDAALMVRVLQDLKELGVHLSVDDFGTGYSALAYLKDLPIDVLKIDRSFVNSMTVDPAGATIVEAIVRMAQGLNLTTVAEGVEQQDQLLMLGSYGCNRLQGFLLGRPVAALRFRDWIADPIFHWAQQPTPVNE